MKNNLPKILLLLAVTTLTIAFFVLGLDNYLSLEALKSRQFELHQASEANPFKFALIFSAVYVTVTGLSVPGATILTLAAGFIFDFWLALLLVSFSSTIGATFAFLASRFILGDFVEKRFAGKLRKINSGVEKEGAFYLFTLRLVPAFPFFLVNLAMGLTKIRTLVFALVSQVGMLPGTAVYVNAGTQLSQLQSLKGILSPSVIASFTAVGIMPLIAKKLVRHFRRNKTQQHFRKPKRFDYNLVVIGAGSGGLVSAYISAAVKAKVALIEKHKMGGDCLNTGCVPSKALISSAKLATRVRNASEFGIDVPHSSVNFKAVMERVRQVVKKIEPHDSVERYESLGVECIKGEAKLLSPFTVKVGDRILTTKNIIIATGAKPLVPEIPGLNEIDYLTSDNIWNLHECPNRLLILGGGPIGCELAQAFQRLGSKVTVVEMSDRIMAREDKDASEFITKIFISEKIKLLISHKAIRFEHSEAKKFLICQNEGREVRVEFDQALIALGRKANTQGFGLEDLGVNLSERGTIAVNEFMQTNYSNIYACGDVAGPFQFTHTAAHQAWFASVNALFSPLKKFRVDYSVIPWCTFVEPEVARVGVSEAEASENNVDFEVSKFEISDLDRAIAEGEDRGFVKVITAKGSDKILGVTIVGNHAGELIAEYVTAMKYKIGLKKILATIHIYPTLAEANKYAAGIWQQNHKPEFALKIVEKFHRWRRG